MLLDFETQYLFKECVSFPDIRPPLSQLNKPT